MADDFLHFPPPTSRLVIMAIYSVSPFAGRIHVRRTDQRDAALCGKSLPGAHVLQDEPGVITVPCKVCFRLWAVGGRSIYTTTTPVAKALTLDRAAPVGPAYVAAALASVMPWADPENVVVIEEVTNSGVLVMHTNAEQTRVWVGGRAHVRSPSGRSDVPSGSVVTFCGLVIPPEARLPVNSETVESLALKPCGRCESLTRGRAAGRRQAVPP